MNQLESLDFSNSVARKGTVRLTQTFFCQTGQSRIAGKRCDQGVRHQMASASPAAGSSRKGVKDRVAFGIREALWYNRVAC